MLEGFLPRSWRRRKGKRLKNYAMLSAEAREKKKVLSLGRKREVHRRMSYRKRKLVTSKEKRRVEQEKKRQELREVRELELGRVCADEEKRRRHRSIASRERGGGENGRSVAEASAVGEIIFERCDDAHSAGGGGGGICGILEALFSE